MKKRLKWLIPFFALGVLAGAFLLYTGSYYHADADALAALASDEAVAVTPTSYGWLFDGPSESDALIFYPGAKVEETAYAPLLRQIAARSMDVCLVKMPFRLAFFGIGKADGVMAAHRYARWYIGGHSLGGAMAAYYAAAHGAQLEGVLLLAAYPTQSLDGSLAALSVYGSEDGVLSFEKVAEGRQFMPDSAEECVIEGGNHAQFGNYGPQKGDGIAAVSAEEQQRQTVELIMRRLLPGSGV